MSVNLSNTIPHRLTKWIFDGIYRYNLYNETGTTCIVILVKKVIQSSSNKN